MRPAWVTICNGKSSRVTISVIALTGDPINSRTGQSIVEKIETPQIIAVLISMEERNEKERFC